VRYPTHRERAPPPRPPRARYPSPGVAQPPAPPPRALRGQGAAGARISHVGDLIDGDVVEAAVHLADFTDIDEGLDHVVGLGIEAESAARAVELHLRDGVDQLVLVLRVPVDGLERPH